MSVYKVVEVELTSQKDVIAGLLELGLSLDEIEIHNNATSLYGYKGDQRSQKANIIVRRKNVNKRLSSGASNDLGFEEVNGKYIAHVSDYDQSWWTRKSPVFKRGAATSKVEREAKKRGYRVTKVKEGQKTKLKLIKNY